MTFSPELLQQATDLLAIARAKNLKIATAESCTGGLIAALLTEIPGSSDVVERGFVTYSNRAKTDLLGVPESLLDAHGAVSAKVGQAMAEGARRNAPVALAVAVTGVAGPGRSENKPVGLVFIAVSDGKDTSVEEKRFGELTRDQVRLKTVAAALALLKTRL